MRAHLYGHHPTIITTYNRVDVMLTTHDEGEGEVTDIDLKFAKRIDGMVDGFKLSDNETKSIGECHGGILAGILGLK
ncbi:hypothetical protein WICPIJ_001571 [Wickerhamomyces pijperi]|uniref:4a-hydroxytetrahydrobiopterin dehydratase n=1 Tax=Wickerhamomyces pijperi TaxID=599730 RepID=A0A9P8QBG8_WICPI|nr:hypothetical protein WICPIJ_001571 [Wickerhamomyces pijperi]